MSFLTSNGLADEKIAQSSKGVVKFGVKFLG
jgi:hypothetical protein